MVQIMQASLFKKDMGPFMASFITLPGEEINKAIVLSWFPSFSFNIKIKIKYSSEAFDAVSRSLGIWILFPKTK